MPSWMKASSALPSPKMASAPQGVWRRRLRPGYMRRRWRGGAERERCGVVVCARRYGSAPWGLAGQGEGGGPSPAGAGGEGAAELAPRREGAPFSLCPQQRWDTDRALAFALFRTFKKKIIRLSPRAFGAPRSPEGGGSEWPG